ncbi:hypothetical protein FGADI_12110 [Fusarium gaditjirri]|uniref:Glycosyltransferase 2-like domain-containing protein n=1 Tax=Fusarium gaditjirri TaxID=282569 RepID=A0A8H4WPF4_9HYPO|nr:hypothetical protein FGADI_12110 [Fusarium gaditjirri]
MTTTSLQVPDGLINAGNLAPRTIRVRSPVSKSAFDRSSLSSPVDPMSDFKEKRTEKAFQVLRFNWLLFPLIISGLFYTLLLPSHLFGFYSHLCTLYPFRPDQWKKLPKKWTFERFMICVVTRGDNFETVKRTVSSIEHLPIFDQRITIHILTPLEMADKFQRYYGDRIQVDGVPADYTPLKAKHKARSLEWFRIENKVTENDWILHLDEETVVDNHAIRTCFDFIQRRPHKELAIAQGAIMYNEYNYWNNWLLTAGDNVRIADELGRFQFQINALNYPFGGLHGSFLLVNGEVENEVTWDDDNIVEDFYFGLAVTIKIAREIIPSLTVFKAYSKGFKSAWLPTFVREQSPMSIKDYILQRRRWYTGIWQLNILYVRVVLGLWACMPLELFFWGGWFIYRDSAKVPEWLFFVIAFDDWDSGMSWTKILLTRWRVPLLLPLVRLIEMAAVVVTIASPAQGFDVIKK